MCDVAIPVIWEVNNSISGNSLIILECTCSAKPIPNISFVIEGLPKDYYANYTNGMQANSEIYKDIKFYERLLSQHTHLNVDRNAIPKFKYSINLTVSSELLGRTIHCLCENKFWKIQRKVIALGGIFLFSFLFPISFPIIHRPLLWKIL